MGIGKLLACCLKSPTDETSRRNTPNKETRSRSDSQSTGATNSGIVVTVSECQTPSGTVNRPPAIRLENYSTEDLLPSRASRSDAGSYNRDKVRVVHRDTHSEADVENSIFIVKPQMIRGKNAGSHSDFEQFAQNPEASIAVTTVITTV